MLAGKFTIPTKENKKCLIIIDFKYLSYKMWFIKSFYKSLFVLLIERHEWVENVDARVKECGSASYVLTLIHNLHVWIKHQPWKRNCNFIPFYEVLLNDNFLSQYDIFPQIYLINIVYISKLTFMKKFILSSISV